MILTGRKRIKDLREGEEVWARDEATGEMGFRQITATHVNSYDETVTLVIRDAATSELQTIVSNRLHPYFVSHVAPQMHLVANGPTLRGTLATGHFVEALHIDIGAWLITEAGLEAEIVAKTIDRAPLTAYNLTVAEFETYFASGSDNDNAPGVWVHNCGKTALGFIRENPAAWRKTADLWQSLGMDVLSAANIQKVAKGITPTVDAQWLKWFPTDTAYMGQRISMHHVGGTGIAVPLPRTRHLQAHMPGGFRYNRGGPGSNW